MSIRERIQQWRDERRIGREPTRAVTVTQADIDNGQPARSWDCPVALAARDVFPDAVSVHVFHSTIEVMYVDRIEWWQPHGDLLARFVRKFDSGHLDDVEPMTFGISLMRITRDPILVEVMASTWSKYEEAAKQEVHDGLERTPRGSAVPTGG